MAKKEVQEEAHLAFHLKYRPKTLDKVIGHDTAVKRLKYMAETKKLPNALLFVGPSSVGKTTLATAFTASLFGVKSVENHPDFKDMNAAGDTRGIEDVKDMLRLSKMQPRTAPRRVILLDEAHGFTGPSAEALLKPLEKPSPKTLFILGTMEPEKLKQAFKNRCSLFVLNPPTEEDLTKYVKRIIKGEEMSYMNDELIKTVVQNSNGEMRSAANIMEAIVQVSNGKKIKKEEVLEALESVETSDDALLVNIIDAVYGRDLVAINRNIIDISGGFQFINKLMYVNRFIISNTVLNGEKHKSVWWSKINMEANKAVKARLKDLNKAKMLAVLSLVQQQLIRLKRESMSFGAPEVEMIGSTLTEAVRVITPMLKDSK